MGTGLGQCRLSPTINKVALILLVLSTASWPVCRTVCLVPVRPKKHGAIMVDDRYGDADTIAAASALRIYGILCSLYVQTTVFVHQRSQISIKEKKEKVGKFLVRSDVGDTNKCAPRSSVRRRGFPIIGRVGVCVPYP